MATGTQLEKTPPALGQVQKGGKWSGLWGLAQVRWAQMDPAQRGWAMVAALLLAALLGGLAWYGIASRLAHALRRSRPGRCAADGADPRAGTDPI